MVLVLPKQGGISLAKLPSDITAIINYLRRSRQDEEREKRTGEDTLSEQKMLMDRVLADSGVPYEQRFEIGSGDKIDTRPVFKEILKDLDKGKWNAIAVKEISRLGRGSYTDMGRIYDLIQHKRIYIVTPYKVYDPQNNADLRQIRFELFLSREEFETTRERLMGARYNYSMQGKWMAGTVPFGYKYNENTQRLDINEDQAEIVRLIFDLYANQNMGYHSVATHLKKRGIKTPTGNPVWQPEVVRRMLSKPVYVGEVNFRVTQYRDGKRTTRPKDEWIVVKDAHPPIIDEDTWEKCQKRLNEKNGKPAVNTDFSPCELASIVSCHKCGKKMVRQYSTQHYEKRDGEKSVYEKEFLRCMCGVYVKYRDVESRLLEILEQFVLDEEKLTEGITATIHGNGNKDTMDVEKLLEKLVQQKESVNRKLERAYELLIDRTFSKEEFEGRRAKYQAELGEIEKQIAFVSHDKEPKQTPTVELEKVRGSISSVIAAYSQLTNKSRKNVLLSNVFDRVELEILERGRGRKSARFDLYVQLKHNLLV